MYDIDELPTFILLGNQRDFGHAIIFDVSAWDDLLPDRYELTYIRPTETAVNPAVGIVYDAIAKTVTWTIGAEVTDISGSGSLVIEAYHGAEQLTHSAAIQTVVGEGHGAVGVAPEPLTNWLEDATAKLAEIDPALLLASDATTAANNAAILANAAAGNADDSHIVSAAFSGDDIVLTTAGADEITLTGAKTTLKGDTGATGATGPKGDAFEYEDFTSEQLAGLVGNGIKSILRTSGDGTPGTTDTYTITFDDDTTTTFPVYNGADAPALSGVKQYIIRWDKVNSQCTRMGDAAAITTTITNFCHRGSVNASYSNPFDNLYPWKYRKLCKVNRAAYAALDPGSPIADAVTMWEGEPGFALDGTGDFDGVYTPEFWGRVWQDDTYVYAGVADGPIPGWIHHEATIGGRYFGALDGDGKITSIGNSFPHRNAQMSAMHTNVTAQGMTLDDIWTWSADTLLMAVEYATLNSETAIGKGVDNLYRQSAEKVGANASIGDTVLKLPNAFVAACVPGALIGLGTTDGGEQTGVTRFISSADLDGADPLSATHKAVTVPALTVNVTTDTFMCIHGQANLPDAAIGSMSGYIGVNGKSNAYYRGRVSHGNFFRYCLGAYRQTGTGKIWVANSRNEAAAADALDTGVHRDTGLALPTESGYIAELHHDSLLPMAPFAKATGGTAGSTNPVGDSCYVPTLETWNTILQLGGRANGGAGGGRFSGSWRDTASASAWDVAYLPYLKTP